MTQTSSGPEATAAKIAQLEAGALAFDNVRDALDHAEQEIVLLRDALRRIADSGGHNIEVDGVIYGPSMYAAKVLS